MADQSRTTVTPLGQALGRVPSGLYILTVRNGDRTTGLLASWVQQAGFDPPMVTVAVRRDRYLNGWLDSTRRFALNQLAVGCKNMIRHFSRGFEPDKPAFEGLSLLDDAEARGGPILATAVSYLDTEVVGQLAEGDHRIYLARVVAGALIDPVAEPFLHVRANGFHY